MSKINDGGPAFPVATANFLKQEGMTLRDWFAGQALVEMTSLVNVRIPETIPVVCKLCYDIADAMLAAREGETP